MVEQLPRGSGSIYLLICENGLYKIGRARNIEARLNGLHREIPIKIDYLHSVLSEHYIDAEQYMHQKFASQRQGAVEWFCLSEDQVQWIRSLRDFDIDKMLLASPIMARK
jgi:predicted GIY-YIG superfamily endonuclease